jgi:hypothetical protein
MRSFSSIAAFLTIVSCLTIAALSSVSSPQYKDTKALASCMELHPERYCRITYDPASIK